MALRLDHRGGKAAEGAAQRGSGAAGEPGEGAKSSRVWARQSAPRGASRLYSSPLVSFSGSLVLTEVQLEGKKAMAGATYLAGARLSGELLG